MSTPGGSGRQFLEADDKGLLYLFRAADLSVFRVEGGAVARKTLAVLERPKVPLGIVLDSAVCPRGDAWVVLTASSQPVRFFSGGEEQRLPQPEWEVTGVACPGGSPAVAVAPAFVMPGAPGRVPDRQPPAMLRWDGEEWTAFLQRLPDDLDRTKRASEVMRHRRAASEVVVGHGSNGGLWVGHAAFYHARGITASGRISDTLEMGPRDVTLRELTSEERKDFDEATRHLIQPGLPVPRPAPILSRKVLGISEGPDGSAYVLVVPGGSAGKLALDRYSRVNARVERVVLDLPQSTNVTSFAAGQDGVYIASPSVIEGTWWVPWEALDGAPWAPLESVVIR